MRKTTSNVGAVRLFLSLYRTAAAILALIGHKMANRLSGIKPTGREVFCVEPMDEVISRYQQLIQADQHGNPIEDEAVIAVLAQRLMEDQLGWNLELSANMTNLQSYLNPSY